MKTASMFAVAFSFALAASLTHAEDRRPSNWGGGPNGYNVTIDTETKLSGASSVCLSKSPSETKHKFGTIVQAVSAAKFAGKRLRFSGYVKTKDVTSHAGLWLRVDSSERGSVAFDNMQRRPITGTNDWYKYEIVLDIPEDGAMINFGALLAGEGKIWIEDLSFEIVTDEVETTNELIRPTNQKIEIPTSLAVEPQNLSFET
jgi:serine/threonine-protein kinase